MPDKHPVAQPVPEYEALAPFWQMMKDINGGTAAMREAGQVYLPMEPAEDEVSYHNRLKRSVFTNFYSEMRDKIIGIPLKDGVILDDDVPEQFVSMMENVDLQGSNLNAFGREVFKSGIDDGVTHILVDFPVTRSAEMRGSFPDGSLTLEQERQLGVRPYAVHIKALDLIGWKYETTASGEKILTQIRYREWTKIPDPENEFAQIMRQRIRVYEIGRVRVFEERPKGDSKESEWIQISEVFTSLDFIPLITLYGDRIAFMLGRPVMLDVGYLNIAHWQSDSDQRNIVHIARVPILFGTGLGDPESGPAGFQLEVGAQSMTKGPKGSTLEYVEHTGQGVESGSKDLKDLEERMEALGMQLLVKRPSGSETATGDLLATASEQSTLGMFAQGFERAMEDVLDLFAMWMNLGEDSGGTVKVFKDFEAFVGTDKNIELLQKDRDRGDLSRQTYWKEAKRRGLLADDFDAEDEAALLEEEDADKMRRMEESGLPFGNGDLDDLDDEAGSSQNGAAGQRQTEMET